MYHAVLCTCRWSLHWCLPQPCPYHRPCCGVCLQRWHLLLLHFCRVLWRRMCRWCCHLLLWPCTCRLCSTNTGRLQLGRRYLGPSCSSQQAQQVVGNGWHFVLYECGVTDCAQMKVTAYAGGMPPGHDRPDEDI